MQGPATFSQPSRSHSRCKNKSLGSNRRRTRRRGLAGAVAVAVDDDDDDDGEEEEEEMESMETGGVQLQRKRGAACRLSASPVSPWWVLVRPVMPACMRPPFLSLEIIPRIMQMCCSSFHQPARQPRGHIRVSTADTLLHRSRADERTYSHDPPKV